MKKKIITLLLAFFILGAASPTLAQSQKQEGKTLSVYPNPASNMLKVQLHSQQKSVPEVQIIDLTGKIVKKIEDGFIFQNSIYKTDIDISDFLAGLYFVKVIQGEKTYTEKLIVK